MRTVLAVGSLLLVSACSSADPVTVAFDDGAGGVARFVVANQSEQDVRSISFELSFRSRDGSVVSVDTVSYASTTDASAGGEIAFVVAGEETFFPARMPPASVSATATVLDIIFFDGTEWPKPSE